MFSSASHASVTFTVEQLEQRRLLSAAMFGSVMSAAQAHRAHLAHLAHVRHVRHVARAKAAAAAARLQDLLTMQPPALSGDMFAGSALTNPVTGLDSVTPIIPPGSDLSGSMNSNGMDPLTSPRLPLTMPVNFSTTPIEFSDLMVFMP